ncbi:alpha/beta fold hydrolase [Sphingobium sp. HWE2-09]|uniref:alpha/beta fold hydrolase n=1 Tax=Sphingobium sp. HWE2-09 TaxID=3108390 RepID=UPI002DC737DB|nr:alpha/beta hydrolase [Sphingobium sp. HWE2-09]
MNVLATVSSKQEQKCSLFYEVHGEGVPVVMVHGLGGSSNVWTPQIATLQRFFKVIRPDLIGSGFSSLNNELISIERYVHDVVGLLDCFEIGSAHFAGHSMGTIVCQHLAAWHPERVKSLALFGPIHTPSDAAREALKARAETSRTRGMQPIADAVVQGGTSADTKANRPEIAAFVREATLRQHPEAYAQTCEALANAQPADTNRIRCPSILVTGDEDGTAPPNDARSLAQKLSDASLTVLSRCGHWTPLERAKDVTEALTSFYFSRTFR